MPRPRLTHTRRPVRLEPLEARVAPAAGPVQIKDVNPLGNSTPTEYTGMGGWVYFAADGPTGNELWRTNGTAAGTTNVADIYPGGFPIAMNGGQPRNLTPVGGTLFLTATDGETGFELWKTTGTAAGTRLVKDIRFGANSSSPALLTAVGSTLFFVATDATGGTELWRSDGTAAGTVQVADLSPGSANSTFHWLKAVGGKLYFAWRPEFGGDVRVERVDPDGGNRTPVVTYSPLFPGLAVHAWVGSRLFYTAQVGIDEVLFVLDTAAAAPTPVPLTSAQITGFGAGRYRELGAVGNRLYFSAATDVGAEPWVSDGTPEGTRLVKDISQDTPTNNPGSGPAGFTDVGGVAYFAATTIADGRELWRSDGTEAGTRRVADLEPGDVSSSPAELVSVGGRLVFDTVSGFTSTLRVYNPAADRVETYSGFALNLFGNPWARAVYRDVLYLTQAGDGGLEPHQMKFAPAPARVGQVAPDTGAFGDGITSATRVRLHGSASPNAAVRVYRQGVLIGSTRSDDTGQWEFGPVSLKDGGYSFRAATVSLTGAQSAPGPAFAVTVDTKAPAAPTVTGLAQPTGPDPTATNDPTPTLAGTAEAHATVTVWNGVTALGTALAGPDGRWVLTAPELNDGSYVITATAADLAGNLSPAGSAVTVVVDTDPPPAPALTGFTDDGGLAGDGLTGDRTPTLLGTAVAGVTIRVKDGDTELGTATVGPGGIWAFTCPVLPDGPHSFTVTAVDGAGNASPPSAPLDLTIDSVRPTATIARAAGQPDPTNVPTVAFTVTFSKPVTGFTAAGVDLSASTVGGTPAAAVSGSGTDYTVTVTGVEGDGPVVVGVRPDAASDVAGNGNTAADGTGAAVRFDAAGPRVTVDRAADQPDPTAAGPIRIAVRFDEPATGFGPEDVSFAGSTDPGSLSAAVTGSGTDYAVSVTGMTGAQTVVVSIPAGAAADLLGNPSVASTGTNNTVTFNDIGILQFESSVVEVGEGVGLAVVTVTRSGSRGAVSAGYAVTAGTARTPSDFAPASGTLSWPDGDDSPRTFTVPVVDDPDNEGRETIHLALGGPTDGAILGPRSTAELLIAPSDGRASGMFVDADGDVVSVRLTPGTGAGSVRVFQTDPDGDGQGPIELIELDGTTTRSTLAVTARKVRGGTGDGRVEVRAITGGDLGVLTARTADLAGPGIGFNGYVRSLAVGDLQPGSSAVTGGPPTLRTALAFGTVADGVSIVVGSGISRLSAAAIGSATITAPRAGTIAVRGDLGGTITLSGAGVTTGKPALALLTVGGSMRPSAAITAPSVGTVRVRQDFEGELTVSGTGVSAGRPALAALSVAGAVRDSDIRVGGNVSLVTAGSFVGSRLFAGYAGPDDGSGSFNLPAVVGTVRVTGKENAFADSYLIATAFRNVALASVDPDGGGVRFGVFADEAIDRATVGAPTRFTFPEQDALGDFQLRVV